MACACVSRRLYRMSRLGKTGSVLKHNFLRTTNTPKDLIFDIGALMPSGSIRTRRLCIVQPGGDFGDLFGRSDREMRYTPLSSRLMIVVRMSQANLEN
jgi:hypothetical protein